uniref:Arrestin C-terminal-like domain-containing protein n=1 Tax=Takifugu rubripes TaxID=31033 RepID=H2SHB9_TAKRU
MSLPYFHLVYNVPNSEETFSEGDTVGGAVSFVVTKESKVKSILVKLKGEASVSWEEGMGDDATTYSDRRRYFKVKNYLVTQDEGEVMFVVVSPGSTLRPGLHNFNFTLAIPQGNFPSSFNGQNGKIIYTLEAKISRSWRMPSQIQRELKFLSRPPANRVQMLVFKSYTYSIEMNLLGETAAVVVNISNQSSTKMRPKVKLQECVEYRARSRTTTSSRNWGKLVGETVKGNSEGIFHFQVKIPDEIIPSILNCEIISVDYNLKVYLDISFARDPEVQLPLMIIPSTLAYLYSAAAGGAPTCSDFPPSEPSSFYGPPAPYNTQDLNTWGFQDQLPPTVAPSSEHPLFPDEGPPSYQSLWPPYNTCDALGQTKKITSNKNTSF